MISNRPLSFYHEAPTAIRLFRCPSCNETISAEARTCRFCNVPIDAATAEQLTRDNQRVTTAIARANTFRISILAAVILVFAGVMNWLTNASFNSVFLPLIPIGYGLYWLYKNRSLVTKDADFPPAVKKVKQTLAVWLAVLVLSGALATLSVAKNPFVTPPRDVEVKGAVDVQGTNPLTFELSGPGSVTNFSVGIFTPALPEDSPDRVQLIWELMPTDILSDTNKLQLLDRITYGTVPDGFYETRPAPRLAPLEPGKYYVFYLLRMSGPHVMGAFELKDGQPSRVYGLSFCTKLNQKWERIWVRCDGDVNPAE